MFKVNNRNTRPRREICLKLTIKTPEQRQCRRSGVVLVNFEHVIAGWAVTGKCFSSILSIMNLKNTGSL